MYVLVKGKGKYKIEGLIEYIGYQITLNGEHIMLANQMLKDRYIRCKYEPGFNKFIYNIISFIENDPDSDNATLLLGELERERNVFLNKFAKYLSPKEREYFMRKIRLIANELKQISLTKASIKSSSRGMRR